MKGQYTEPWNCKSVLGVATAGLAFGSLFCKLDGAVALGCQLLDNIAWAAVEVVRPIVMLAAWQGVPSYLFENARVCQHLVQIGASVWPMFRVLTGQA